MVVMTTTHNSISDSNSYIKATETTVSLSAVKEAASMTMMTVTVLPALTAAKIA